MGLLRLLEFIALVAVSNSYAIPLALQNEVYEDQNEMLDNPYMNLGAKTRLVEGDMALPPGRNALTDTAYRWKFPIPYILADSLDLNAKGAIMQAFEMYRLKSCVDFKRYNGEKTYIKFEKFDGCWSMVGDQQTGQNLSLGSGCDHKAVIEHELLHALGFYHEQSRSDRDDYVDIWLDQVIPGMEHNFNKYDDSFITDQNTPYDYESIMHYRPYSFNKNESIPTITTKIEAFNNIIGQYLDFSALDVIRLNRMYNCSSPLTLLDQCTFEYINICGMIQGSSDEAEWVHTLGTPGSEDHTLIGRCEEAGFFMHFDTAIGKAGESAVLESRILYPRREKKCLQFFYRMTGSPKDKLVIWLKTDDGTGKVRKLKKVHTFWADGDGDWKIAHVPLEVGVKFRYVFQGIRGDPALSRGGMSIDDISLSETHCPSAAWQIRNFSSVLQAANESTVLLSPRFYSPEGYGFGVQLRPRSTYSDYTGGYTELSFHLASGENDGVLQWPAVQRQATLTVMDQDPDIKLRMSSARSLTTDGRLDINGMPLWGKPSVTGTYDATCQCFRGSSRGWRNFIKHFDLRRRNYLKNDDLIIFADFEDLTPLVKTEVPVRPPTE